MKLLDRTQNRLATGKKVNSALDNPVSFFTSVSLTDRASKLHGLKDTTSEAIQTLKTADRGIAALSTMIEQAKSIAEKALSASSTGSATTTGAITLSGLSAGVAGPTMTLTLNGIVPDDRFFLKLDSGGGAGGFYAIAGPTAAWDFHVGADDNETAQNVASSIESVNWAAYEWGYHATYLGGNQVRISKYDANTLVQETMEASDIFVSLANVGSFDPQVDVQSDEVAIGGVTFTATTGATAGTSFNVGGTDTENLQELADAINAYGGWAGGVDYGATVTDGRLILSKTVGGVATAVDAGDFSTNITGGGSGSMSLIASSSELAVLEAQYNTMRSQLTTLALDSYYKGKNLLNAQNMTVRFESTSLLVAGFDASAAGLGLTEATWTTGGDINADIILLESALARLRRGSAEMSNNLSIITARQTFSETMENILTEGSDRLTLADTSEEGANMLMLQTRQSLSMNVLSLAADAAQSVLQLFR